MDLELPRRNAMTDPRYAEIESHRPYLLRYALSQLRDAQLAEEAVQEALVSALESVASFRGKSTLRTWLTSILRFKVVDLQRRAIAERRAVDSGGAGAADEDRAWEERVFDETGHWRQAPRTWGDPEVAFEQRRFWEVFERCLDALPPQAGRVFFRREVLGEDTETICKAEGITATNCWVILHRARVTLRGCLGRDWFGEGEADGASRG